jgi:hypothetical protein
MKDLVDEKQLHILSFLQRDLLKLFAKYFQQSNLSFAKFAELWREQEVYYLHVLCPERLQYQAYLQIIYYALLKWLFIDYSQHGTILNASEFPFLTNITERPLRLLVGNIPILYSIYILYQTQLTYRNPTHDFFPIRFDKLALEYMDLTVNTIKTTLSPTIGKTVEALWKALKEPQAPSTYPNIVLCEYTGPASIQFCAIAKHRMTLFSIPHWKEAIQTHQTAYTEYLQSTFQYGETEAVEADMTNDNVEATIIPIPTSNNASTTNTTSPLFQQIHSLPKEVLADILQSIQTRRQQQLDALQQKQQLKQLRYEKQQARMKALLYPTRKQCSSEEIQLNQEQEEPVHTLNIPPTTTSSHLFMAAAEKKRKLRAIEDNEEKVEHAEDVQYIPLPSGETKEIEDEEEDGSGGRNHFWDDFKEFVGISVGPKLVNTIPETDIPVSTQQKSITSIKSTTNNRKVVAVSSRNNNNVVYRKETTSDISDRGTNAVAIDEDDYHLADEILKSFRTRSASSTSQKRVTRNTRKTKNTAASSSSSSSTEKLNNNITKTVITNEHEQLLSELEAQIMSILHPTTATTTITAANDHPIINTASTSTKKTTTKSARTSQKKASATTASRTRKPSNLLPLDLRRNDTSDSEEEAAVMNQFVPLNPSSSHSTCTSNKQGPSTDEVPSTTIQDAESLLLELEAHVASILNPTATTSSQQIPTSISTPASSASFAHMESMVKEVTLPQPQHKKNRKAPASSTKETNRVNKQSRTRKTMPKGSSAGSTNAVSVVTEPVVVADSTIAITNPTTLIEAEALLAALEEEMASIHQPT